MNVDLHRPEQQPRWEAGLMRRGEVIGLSAESRLPIDQSVAWGYKSTGREANLKATAHGRLQPPMPT